MDLLKSKKLNLGCGYDKRAGYLNVDLNDFHSPDVVANIIELNEFPSNSYQEIIAQDILEHVLRADVRRALFEWNRLLEMGGRIFIRTTWIQGLAALMEMPENQAILAQEGLIQSLFGTQAYNGDFHLTGFTEKMFRFYMWEAGFEIDEMGLVHGAFLDAWARKVRDLSFQALIDSASDDIAFLQSAYREILGRQPLRDEIAHGCNRRELIRKLLLSEERKQRMIAMAPEFPRTLRIPGAKPGLLRRVARKCKRIVKSVLPNNAKRSA